MFEDFATLAPSAIVCVAFCWGIWALIRHEMAPKRVAREDEDQDAQAPASGAAGSTAASPATGSGEEAASSASKHGEL